MTNTLQPESPKGRPAPAAGPRPFLLKTVETGLLALLVLSPLAAGSVNEWSILVIELAAGLMAVAYLLLEPKPPLNGRLEAALGPVKWGAMAFFGYIAFTLVPLPAAVVRLISPGSYTFRRLHAPEFGQMKFMSLSLAPSQTLQAGLEIFAYLILGFLVVKTVTGGSQIRRMMSILIASGVFQALYGLYELSAAEPRILFYRKVFSLDSVTGTFVNRSHFSGYLEMIIPLAVGLVIARMNLFSFGVKGLREKFLLMTSQGVTGNLLVSAGTVIMSLGVVFSNSRAGIAVLVFSFFLFTGLSVLAFGRVGYRELWVRNFIRATVLAVLVLSLWIGIGSTIQRFALDNLLREDRPLYWGNVAGIIRDFPLFGTGLGTFASAYPAFEKRGGPEMLLAHAHNDYLELFSELGLAGSVLLFGGIFYLAVRAFLAWRERRNPEAKGLALGGIVSLAGMGLHTLTDFNLHLPANALLFSVVLSLTLVTAFYRKT